MVFPISLTGKTPFPSTGGQRQTVCAMIGNEKHVGRANQEGWTMHRLPQVCTQAQVRPNAKTSSCRPQNILLGVSADLRACKEPAFTHAESRERAREGVSSSSVSASMHGASCGGGKNHVLNTRSSVWLLGCLWWCTRKFVHQEVGSAWT